ncbi:hypothetical protein FA95DRAFT_226497 [Auriscalpium vulgare]|uniref:Uncharacterized protein n=1 Tax=Auriscalpium vulgare TaxID=40419 RepID=A0ACB8RL66_9AGAM|nr:hypothetical protein FA95DRAFT_226497 [Auriscalpium vulgare]
MGVGGIRAARRRGWGLGRGHMQHGWGERVREVHSLAGRAGRCTGAFLGRLVRVWGQHAAHAGWTRDGYKSANSIASQKERMHQQFGRGRPERIPRTMDDLRVSLDGEAAGSARMAWDTRCPDPSSFDIRTIAPLDVFQFPSWTASCHMVSLRNRCVRRALSFARRRT